MQPSHLLVDLGWVGLRVAVESVLVWLCRDQDVVVLYEIYLVLQLRCLLLKRIIFYPHYIQVWLKLLDLLILVLYLIPVLRHFVDRVFELSLIVVSFGTDLIQPIHRLLQISLRDSQLLSQIGHSLLINVQLFLFPFQMRLEHIYLILFLLHLFKRGRRRHRRSIILFIFHNLNLFFVFLVKRGFG